MSNERISEVKSKIKVLSAAIAAGVIGFISFAACGATQETWDSDKTDPIVLSDDLEVTVASGTVVCSGEISGGYKLIKKGAGTLVLAVNNSFSGGVEIRAGFVEVRAAQALGTGKVTILGGGTGHCCLRFGAADQGKTEVTDYGNNEIEVTGTSTLAYPAIEISCRNNTFAGNITAAEALYINDNAQLLYDWYKEASGSASWSVKVSPNSFMTFSGSVTAGTKIYLVPDAKFTFSGSVKTPQFVTFREGAKPRGNNTTHDREYYGQMTFSGANQIGAFVTGHREIVFSGADAMGGALFTCSSAGNEAGVINLSSGNQIIAGLTDADLYTDSAHYFGNDGYKGTLTITGTCENAELVSSHYLRGASASSFVLDAADNAGFVQEFSGRTNTFAGTLEIRNGTMKFSNHERFSNAFTLKVGANGKLVCDGGAGELFASTLPALYLETGAQLDLAGGTINATKVFFNGEQMGVGNWTAADFPGVTIGGGVIISAKTGVTPSGADWVGGGADDLTSTLANWQVGGVTPESLALKNYSVAATLKSSTSITYRNNDRLYSIINDVPYVDGAIQPFTIGPENEGDTLVIANNIKSDLKTQLVLKGHITTPFGINKDRVTSADGKCIYVNVVQAATDTTGAIIGSGNAQRGVPLVLDGATIDLPLFMKNPNGQITTLFARDGSTNVVNGYACLSTQQGYVEVGAGATIRFMNGFETGNYYHFRGAGVIDFVNKPIDTSNSVEIEQGVRMTFDSTNNVVRGLKDTREGLRIARGTLEFKRDNCFKDDQQIIFTGTDSVYVEFNQTTQRLGRVNFKSPHATKAYLNGTYPAMLEMTGKSRSGATNLAQLECTAQVKGGLGFHTMAPEMTFTLSGRAFESCGDLIVSAGTNALASGATWLNGTNFVMKGEGVMMFAQNGQVNRDFAQFHFSENGKVYIPSGVTLDCRCALVDDGTGEQFLPSGGYGEAATGLMEGRVVGGGMLNVIASTPIESPDYVETTEDMTAQGDWVVEVELGKSNVVTHAQTGTGKIIKKGGGTLVLRETNEFTGGIDIVHGVVCAEANDALGFGEVTIFGGQRDDYVGPCELRFPVCDLTFGSADGPKPSIHVIGPNTAKYPAIGVCSIRNTFYGTITSDYDLYLMDDQEWLHVQKGSWSGGVAPYTGMTLYGDVDVAGKFHLYPDTRYHFYGSVKADTFEAKKNGDGAYLHCGDKAESWTYGQIFFYEANAFNTFFTSHDQINFVAANSMGGACFTNTFVSESASLACSADQTAASICHAKPNSDAAKSFAKVTGASAMTLTLTGTTQNVETYTKFSDALSLVLDAKDIPSFVYTLRELPSTMSGSVTVKNGTLRLIEGACFSNATPIVVEANGALIVEGAAAKSFGATALTVDGALTIDPAVLKNLASLDLALGENAVLTFPAGTTALTVNSLTYKGEKLPASDWNRTEIPVIPEGLTITAKTGQSGVAAETTAIWTGEADDGLMATLGNWEVDGEVPTELDLTSGKTAVILQGGTQMIPEDGMRVNSISNGLPGSATSESFILGKKGVTLTVDGKISSFGGAQLIIRGTIATPWHRDQGAASSNGTKTVSYISCDPGSKNSKATYGAAQKGLVIVLDDATIEKPVYWKSYPAYDDLFVGMNNTTNVITGHLSVQSYNYHNWYVGKNGQVDFRGGISRNLRMRKKGEGELKFTDKPTSGGSGLNHEGGVIVLDAEGCKFGNTGSQNKGFKVGDGTGAILRFARSFCFSDDNVQQLNVTGSAKNNLVDFGSTTQRLSRACANNTGAGSMLTGEAGSMLEVKGGTTLGSGDVLADMIFSTQITGGLGIHYLGNGPAKSGVVPAGSADTLVLTNRAFESTGNLEVDAGTIELAAGAVWNGGFVARGGTLKFSENGQAGSASVLHLADSGKIEIPEGVTIRVAEVDLGGETITEGSFTKNDGTDVGGHIEGAGTLKVGKKGMLLIVQ